MAYPKRYHKEVAMKTLVIIFYCIAIVVVFGCENQSSAEVRHKQEEADNIVKAIHYIKDARTLTCFALSWVGDARGGPAFTTVPCDRIPPQLLTTAKIK